MKFKLLLLAALAGTFFFTACEEDTTEQTEQSYDLSDFSKIDLGDAFKIEITQGNSYEVKARSTARNIDDLRFKVVNGKLTAKYDVYRANRKQTKITIQLPTLTYLRLSGATETDLQGFYNATEDLELQIDGASQLDADVDYDFVDLVMSGASELTINGSAHSLKANISGTSRVYGSDFQTKNVDANVSGVSKVQIAVEQSLTGSVSGSSELRYAGNPNKVQVDVSGGSKLGKL